MEQPNEQYGVRVGNRIVFVLILKGHITFALTEEKKLKALTYFKVDDAQITMKGEFTIPKFLEIARNHELLKQVPNWNQFFGQFFGKLQ